MSYRDIRAWIVPALAIIVGICVVFGSALDEAEETPLASIANDGPDVAVRVTSSTGTGSVTAERAAAPSATTPSATRQRTGDRVDITADEDEEVVDARGFYSSTWRRPDRTMRLKTSLGAMHYKGPGGFLVIDPTVKALDKQPEPFEAEVASETAPAIPFSVDPQPKTAPGETEAPTVAAPDTTAPTSPQIGAPGIEATGYSLANEENLLKTFFAEDRAQVRADAFNISLIYAPSQIRYVDGSQQDVVANAGPSTPQSNENTVTYYNVFKNVDVVYETKPAGISQKFIFHEPPRPPVDGMDLENLTISIGERIQLSESARLSIATGQPISGNMGSSIALQITGPGKDKIHIPLPHATEANSSPSAGGMVLPEFGTYTIEDHGNGEMTMWSNISYAWFNDPDRQYPLIIDPELDLQPDEASSKDAPILVNVGVGGVGAVPSPAFDFSNDLNFATYPNIMEWFIPAAGPGFIPSNSHFRCDAMIEFPAIDPTTGEIPLGSTVNSAELILWHEAFGFNPLEMHNNLATWNEGTVTPNNSPAFNPVPLASFDPSILSISDVFQNWDMLDFVTLTVAGDPDHQFGWRIKRSDETDIRPLLFVGPGSTIVISSSNDFTASERPQLIVDYTPPPPVLNCELVPLCIDPCAGPCVYQVQGNAFDPFPQGDQDIEVKFVIDLGPFAFNMNLNDFLVIKLKGSGPPKVGFQFGVPSVTAQEVCLTCTATSSFSGVTATETECLPPCPGDDDDDDDD